MYFALYRPSATYASSQTRWLTDVAQFHLGATSGMLESATFLKGASVPNTGAVQAAHLGAYVIVASCGSF
jgi:hypothetical protein